MKYVQSYFKNLLALHRSFATSWLAVEDFDAILL
jgi:hypothetical protein